MALEEQGLAINITSFTYEQLVLLLQYGKHEYYHDKEVSFLSINRVFQQKVIFCIHRYYTNNIHKFYLFDETKNCEFTL